MQLWSCALVGDFTDLLPDNYKGGQALGAKKKPALFPMLVFKSTSET